MEQFLCYASVAGFRAIPVSYPLPPERLLPARESARFGSFKAASRFH
jgi:hypothetical protein